MDPALVRKFLKLLDSRGPRAVINALKAAMVEYEIVLMSENPRGAEYVKDLREKMEGVR